MSVDPGMFKVDTVEGYLGQMIAATLRVGADFDLGFVVNLISSITCSALSRAVVHQTHCTCILSTAAVSAFSDCDTVA